MRGLNRLPVDSVEGGEIQSNLLTIRVAFGKQCADGGCTYRVRSHTVGNVERREDVEIRSDETIRPCDAGCGREKCINNNLSDRLNGYTQGTSSYHLYILYTHRILYTISCCHRSSSSLEMSAPRTMPVICKQ